MAITITEYSGLSITSTPVKVVTDYSGLSMSSTPVKVVTNYSGVSLLSEPIKVITDYSGISLVQLSNLFINIVDSSTLLPLDAESQISNLTDPSDVHTNATSGFESNQHIYQIFTFSEIEVTISKAGYVTKTVNLGNLDSANVYQFEIQLDVLPDAEFGCTTTLNDVNGQEIGVIAENEETIVRTKFQGTSTPSPNEYYHVLTVFPENGDKKSGVEIASTFIEVDNDALIYEASIKAGQFIGRYCITSRLNKLLC